MRLSSDNDVIHNPGLKDINEALASLIMHPERYQELIFDNGDYVRLRWDHMRGLYLSFHKDGNMTLVNSGFIKGFHDLEITLYRVVRGEKPKEGELWTPIEKAHLFNYAPYLSLFARLMIYLCFGLIISMLFYELFINPLKINFLEVTFILSTVIGFSLSYELFPYFRYRNYLNGTFFKNNIHWGFWLTCTLGVFGVLGLMT